VWGQAIARAAITVMILAAVVSGLTLDATGARMMSFVFVAAAVAMWAVSAHDAVREAEGRSREAILQGRMFLYVVLVLLGLLVVQMFLGVAS
jgi:heme O synthase-like polyprenyltransferase